MVKIDVPQQQYMKTLETGHGRIFYNKLTEIHLLDPTFYVLTINNMGGALYTGMLGLRIEWCLLALWSVSIELW